ncbi:helix-turn-helix domain-containing protein [Micromonospora sp. PLK6-60]|nr:helix-turn-helix domain-containing protein [Micromonospora sp. PLK6-60]
MAGLGATSGEAIDLGATLRALRRRADLSQRELAARSGIPQGTIARIESGQATDPRFRTVERLARAVNAQLTVSLPAGDTSAGDAPAGDTSAGDTSAGDNPAGDAPAGDNPAGDTPAGVGSAALAVGADGPRDAAGRHCPAHLDGREVREPRDWPGAWWAGWYDLPEPLWPLKLPAATWRLDRRERDRRRRGAAVRRRVQIRRPACRRRRGG